MKIKFVKTHTSVHIPNGPQKGAQTQINNTPDCILELKDNGVMIELPEEFIFIPFANVPHVTFDKSPPEKPQMLKDAEVGMNLVISKAEAAKVPKKK